MSHAHGRTNLVDEEFRRRFEEAWHRGQPLAIADCLPPARHPQYLATLEELVHIELELAWKIRSESPAEQAQAQPPRVEDYVHRFPELKQTESSLCGIRLVLRSGEWWVNCRLDACQGLLPSVG